MLLSVPHLPAILILIALFSCLVLSAVVKCGGKDGVIMETYSVTLLVAIITTFAAIFAPVLTALINNFFLMESQKAEYNRAIRSKAFENYLNAAESYIYLRDAVTRTDYIKALSIAYLYAPKKAASEMNELDLMIVSDASSDELESRLVITARYLGEVLSKK